MKTLARACSTPHRSQRLKDLVLEFESSWSREMTCHLSSSPAMELSMRRTRTRTRTRTRRRRRRRRRRLSLMKDSSWTFSYYTGYDYFFDPTVSYKCGKCPRVVLVTTLTVWRGRNSSLDMTRSSMKVMRRWRKKKKEFYILKNVSTILTNPKRSQIFSWNFKFHIEFFRKWIVHELWVV